MDLHIDKISKTFSRNGDKNTVLAGIDFRVHEGEFISLLGPSGCGKTTLLTIIAGFQKATGGQIILNGEEVNSPGPDRGFVFQDYALFPWMTVQDNILFPMKEMGIPKAQREKDLRRLLQLSKLAGHQHLFPSQISGGMKQRTAFVRALAGSPQVLLMDEPLGAVDHQMRQSLQEELETIWLKDKTTVVMVTHDVDEAIYLSDRVIVMSASRGRVVADVSITLERPRERVGSEYTKMREELTEYLRQGFQEGQ